MKKMLALSLIAVVTTIVAALPTFADELPDPDGKPADMSKKVKVFIIMGQSNTLEMGKVAGDKDGTLEHAVKTEGLYPFMIDDARQLDKAAGRSQRTHSGQRWTGRTRGRSTQ